MKNILSFALITSVLSSSIVSVQAEVNDAVYYTSLNRAIRLGKYQGMTDVKSLKQHGNFGLGSEEKLNSELVVIDGKAYSISTDGKAKIMPDKAKIAFSAIKFFKSDKKITLDKSYNLNQLQELLSSKIDKNAFTAIKVTGKFSSIRYSVYQPQVKPYKPIKEVQMKYFDKKNIEGTLVGFYTPESAKVLNSPVYHFHFIDKNKTTGGHVQNCMISNISIEVDYTEQLMVNLGNVSNYGEINLNQPIKENDD